MNMCRFIWENGIVLVFISIIIHITDIALYIAIQNPQVIKECLKVLDMMTSSNGNIFRVTGPLCGEFTGPGEFPAQRPVTRNFDVSFDLRLNKRLCKQAWGWWFETPAWSLWRQRDVRWITMWNLCGPVFLQKCVSICILVLCDRVSLDGGKTQDYFDGLVQDCSNFSVLAMELLQSLTKPSIRCLHHGATVTNIDKVRFGQG